MFIRRLRQVGGFLVLAGRAPIYEFLGLKAGLAVEGGRLAVERRPGPKYTLETLLAASDYSGVRSGEDADWLGSGAVGREIL